MADKPTVIRFVESGQTFGGRPIYNIVIINDRDVIGRIVWYPAQGEYLAEFEEETVWPLNCLEDVAAFIRGLL